MKFDFELAFKVFMLLSIFLLVILAHLKYRYEDLRKLWLKDLDENKILKSQNEILKKQVKEKEEIKNKYLFDNAELHTEKDIAKINLNNNLLIQRDKENEIKRLKKEIELIKKAKYKDVEIDFYEDMKNCNNCCKFLECDINTENFKKCDEWEK
jgi:hypothetical protein